MSNERTCRIRRIRHETLGSEMPRYEHRCSVCDKTISRFARYCSYCESKVIRDTKPKEERYV